MKKFLKFLGFFILVLIAVFLLLTARNFYLIKTGGLVKWNNEWYTKKELAEKFPPQYYEAEAKNTPEEVYLNFRQALLDGDTEKALEYVVEEKKESYQQAFKDEEKLKNFLKIPEISKIKKAEKDCYENYCSYYYFLGNNVDVYNIIFEKNESGYWEITFI